MYSTRYAAFHRTESLRPVEQGLVALTAVCTVVVSVWVLLVPPARDYETIYQAYPMAFWTLLVLGLVATLALFVLSSVTGDGYWKLSLLFVSLLYVLFLMLPLFRGWALYGRYSADVLAHIGFSAVVADTGHLDPTDYYPASHLLVAQLDLLGIPASVSTTLLAALFTPLYIVGVYLLNRRLFGDHRVALATLACAVPLFYSQLTLKFLPAMLSFMLLPVFLWLFVDYVRTRRASLAASAALVFALLVFFHPVTAMYALVALFVSLVVRVVDAFRKEESVAFGPHVLLLGFGTALWALWYGRFRFIVDSLYGVLGGSQGGGDTVAAEYGTESVLAARSLQQIVVGFVEHYGPIFLVCGLAAAAAVLVLVRFWRRRSHLAEDWLTGQFATGVAISLVSLFTYVVAFDPIRNSRYMVLMATLLAGVLLYWLGNGDTVDADTRRTDGAVRTDGGRGSGSGRGERPDGERRPVRTDGGSGGGRRRQLAFVCVVVLLAASVPIATANTLDTRYHMTYSEREGADWLYDNGVPERITVSQHVNDNKMRMYTQGVVYYGNDSVVGFGDGSPMPKYFGYHGNATVGESFDPSTGEERVYLVTKEYDTEYQLVQDEATRDELVVYDDASLARLSGDVTVDKLYTNGGYTVWVVTVTGTSSDSERVETTGGASS